MKVDLNQEKNNSQKLTVVFSNLRQTWMIIDAKTLVRPHVGREDVLNLTTHVKESFVGIETLLTDIFSKDHEAKIRDAYARVDDAALGYYQAEIEWESSLVLPVGVDFKKHFGMVREDDKKLFDWAVGPFRENEAAQAVLADIRSGTGRRDDAEDVVRLVGLYRQYGVRTSDITDAYLDAAEERATAQINYLRSSNPDTTGSFADIRRRAYTHWVELYNIIVRAGRYVTKDPEQGAALFPGAHPSRNPTPPSKAPTTGQATGQAAPTSGSTTPTTTGG